MARGAATMMYVLGALALITGLVLIAWGPQLVEGGTVEEEEFFGDDDRQVTERGRDAQRQGWIVGVIGAGLLLLGAVIHVASRGRVA